MALYSAAPAAKSMLLDEQGSDQAMAKVEDEEPIDDEPAAKAGAGNGGGGKRKLLLIAAGSLVLILGVGAGAYFSGFLDGFLGATVADTETEDSLAATPTFYALPEILVSLNTSERRSTFLKVKMSLELASPEDQSRVELLLPRIVDYCHVYMRELRFDEVRGSAGSARLREELLRRIAAAVAPVPVRDVLFNELFIQ
jgi:flagellar FliL protein